MVDIVHSNAVDSQHRQKIWYDQDARVRNLEV